MSMSTLEWMDMGLCRQVDGELFFPEQGCSSSEAKQVCMSCDVRAECLEYALTNGEKYGIWAGLSPHQRKRLQAERRRP